MDTDRLAAMCKALGDPVRLRIFEFLRSCCCGICVADDGRVRPVDGPTVGEVCCQIGVTPRSNSTISFHLKELRLAGLISTERRGRCIVCRVNEDALDELRSFVGAGPGPASQRGMDHE
jgi:ArsR family transcriptional regulator